MKEYLKEYQENNPEKFNEELFELRKKEDVLEAVTEVLKTLEILDEVKLDYVKLETDESQFGPIRFNPKQDKNLYKAILPSRLDKITYRFIITPMENTENSPVLSDDEEGGLSKKDFKITENSYYREESLYINKLIDDWFYLNEGSRYYLIYQIVDNAMYGTGGDSISLKSLLMPITIQKKPGDNILVSAEGSNNTYSLPSYNLILFSKSINVLLYYLAKYSFNNLISISCNPDEVIEKRNKQKFPEIIEKINKFFNINLKFSDNLNDLLEDGREVFRLPNESCFVSVEKEKLEKEDSNLFAILGCFFNIKSNGKQKKKLNFSYDDLISPMFWVNTLGSYFTVNTDPIRKFEKVKTTLVSLDRLTDNSTRKILRFPEEDKKNTLSIIRYMLRNFNEFNEKDPNDFDDKRIRIIESLLFPLRDYISKQIYRILNAPTRSKQVLDRIFSNLTPTFLLKTTIVSELLRFYNATNEIDFFTILKVTQTGPQSLTKTVSNNTRDVQPSQVGRCSLVASSASNPGLSSILTPFCELEPGLYFAPEKNEKEKG